MTDEERLAEIRAWASGESTPRGPLPEDEYNEPFLLRLLAAKDQEIASLFSQLQSAGRRAEHAQAAQDHAEAERDAALAQVGVMREPSDKMLAAGAAAIDEYYNGTKDAPFEGSISACWTAMYDVARAMHDAALTAWQRTRRARGFAMIQALVPPGHPGLRRSCRECEAKRLGGQGQGWQCVVEENPVIGWDLVEAARVRRWGTCGEARRDEAACGLEGRWWRRVGSERDGETQTGKTAEELGL